MYINLITIDLCPGQGGGGVTPSGTLTISENGEYNVYNYASASVDVHPSISLSETYLSNGSYTITGEFNGGMVTVNVPSPQFVTESLSVSANGTYTPGQGVDGYSQVVVDVPVAGWDQKSITEGTIEIINLDNSASFVASSAFMNNSTIQTVNLQYAKTVNQYAFCECPSLSQVSLPVCSVIEYNAFRRCYSLTQVDLPMCISIGYEAFGYCSSLSQVSLPVCSYINRYGFWNCSSLSQVSLPVCSFIDTNAFEDCSSLSQVYIPMCSSIGQAAFGRCSSLSQVNLPVCRYIGDYAFNSCPLIQMDLPVCSSIGDGAFADCSSLNQVSLPVCEHLHHRVFNGCMNLPQISLPVCRYIGYMCFYSCSSLSIITIGFSNVCYLYDSEVFTNTPIASGTGSIYVPVSLVDAYKSAQYWSYFSSQIFPISE